MFFSLGIIKEITSREYLTRGDSTTGASGSSGTSTTGTTSGTGSAGGSGGADNIDAMLKDLVAKIDAKGLLYEYNERAAILQYDGGLTREDADRVAAVEIINRK